MSAHRLCSSAATLPVAAILALMAWFAGGGTDWMCLLCGALSAAVLLEMNNAFAIMGQRTTLPVSLFLCLWAATFTLHPGNTASILQLLSLIVLWTIMRCYQDNGAVGGVFLLFLLTGVGSMFWAQTLWAVPGIYLTLAIFRALCPRTFFAGLAGLLMPYWVVSCLSLCMESLTEVWQTPLRAVTDFAPIDYGAISVSRWVLLGYVAVLSAVGIADSLMNGHRDKLRTRSFLRLLMWLQLACFVFLLCQPCHFDTVLALMLAPCAILAAHLFCTAPSTRAARIFFFTSVVLLLVIIVCNLWMPSYNFF